MLTNQANNPRKNILFVTNPSSGAACRRQELERAGWGVTPVAEFIEALSVVRNRRVVRPQSVS